MTWSTGDSINSDPNQRVAQKLISGIRNLYCASSHLSESDIKQKIQRLLNDFAEQAPARELDTATIFQTVKNYFSIQELEPHASQHISSDQSQAQSPSPPINESKEFETLTFTSRKPTSQNSTTSTETTQTQTLEKTDTQNQQSVLNGLGYDGQLAGLLLSAEELKLSAPLQRKQMLARVNRAKICAQQNGFDLLEILDNMDLVIKAKNESFLQAVNQSFYTIIHHLNPRGARKMGLPLASDIGRPRWLDFKRMKRLVEYIECGRMAKDTAIDYTRRLKGKLRQS